MKALAAVLLVCVAACGEGKAIFNVDVYSFMGTTNIPYGVPPAGSGSVSTFFKVQLPGGFGSSIVDTVRVAVGSADLINSTGTGSIGFSIYLASDSAGTLSSPSALDVPATNVSGANTVPVVITGDLSPAFNDLFTKDAVWMRLEVRGTNSGVTPVSGNSNITALVLRVVLQDKVL